MRLPRSAPATGGLPDRMPRPIHPFKFMAAYLEGQDYPSAEAVAEASAMRDRCLAAVKLAPELETDDTALALLLAGALLNRRQRQTLMALCASQEAIDLLWAMDAQTKEA